MLASQRWRHLFTTYTKNFSSEIKPLIDLAVNYLGHLNEKVILYDSASYNRTQRKDATIIYSIDEAIWSPGWSQVSYNCVISGNWM